MTTMKNKTLNNLEIIWHQLDEACSFLDNAQTNLSRINNLPPNIKTQNDLLDLSAIVVLKNEIETLIDSKMKFKK